MPVATAPTIAIIGAGFSGTLLALHTLRRCPAGTRILLIERGRFGTGQAYSTGNPAHLLNVPAGRMSAFHDRPQDFLDWLQTRPQEAGCAPPTGECFVSRRLYGQYIRHLLKDELRRPESRRCLRLIRGEVLGLEAGPATLTLRLDQGRALQADTVVLATGNLPPEPLPVPDPSFYDGDLYRADPWAPDALAGIDPDQPVLLIGTGLTMCDVTLSLLNAGHRGTIHALSRRGLVPHRHASHAGPELPPPLAYPTRLLPLLRCVRDQVRRIEAVGGHWQSAIDQLRPHTVELWQAMGVADRRRFLIHLRRWWDVHRHRMAAPVADRIDAARREGRLRIHAGHLRSLAIRDGMAELVYRPRCRTETLTLRAARVVNCFGPETDYRRIRHKLIRSLLDQGLVRPDGLRLGLDVTPQGALLDRSGTASERLFAVGPATRGAFWEITAVPDIRRQTEALAGELARLARTPPGWQPTAQPMAFKVAG